MYIDIDTINSLAKLIGSLAVISGLLASAYKLYLRDKHQSKLIKDIQTEQTLLCFGIKACLQGLIEQGCDGPCKEALDKLEKHLNQKAHEETAE
jgi:uncharacterized membrane protein